MRKIINHHIEPLREGWGNPILVSKILNSHPLLGKPPHVLKISDHGWDSLVPTSKLWLILLVQSVCLSCIAVAKYWCKPLHTSFLFSDNLGNDEEDKVSVVSDLESIITFFCKSRNEKYTSDNGWLEIIQPLLALKLSRAELYNCFYAIVNKFVTR